MMININWLKKGLLFLILVVFLILCNLIGVNAFDMNSKIKYKWIIIFAICIVVIFFGIIIKQNFISKQLKKNRKFGFMLLWETFIIVTFISKLMHGEFLIFEFILYSAIIPASFFSVKIQSCKNTILIASIVSIIPLMSILGPLNSLGIIICIAGINSYNLLNIYEKKEIYTYIVLVLFGILIYITESRTSLIAFLLVSALVIFPKLKHNNSFKKLIVDFIIILFISVLIYFSYDYIYNLIFEKYTINNVDMFSGRSRIWIGTFETGITLFGNGEQYFMDTYHIGDAHNIFIEILGAYGLLSFISYILLYVYIILKAVKNIKKTEYIFNFSAFLLLGMAENLLFINSRMLLVTILFFTYLGSLINEQEIN